LAEIEKIRKLTSAPNVGETKQIGIDQVIQVDNALIGLNDRLLNDYGHMSQSVTFPKDLSGIDQETRVRLLIDIIVDFIDDPQMSGAEMKQLITKTASAHELTAINDAASWFYHE
jgi:hypothetical protein